MRRTETRTHTLRDSPLTPPIDRRATSLGTTKRLQGRRRGWRANCCGCRGGDGSRLRDGRKGSDRLGSGRRGGGLLLRGEEATEEGADARGEEGGGDGDGAGQGEGDEEGERRARHVCARMRVSRVMHSLLAAARRGGLWSVAAGKQARRGGQACDDERCVRGEGEDVSIKRAWLWLTKHKHTKTRTQITRACSMRCDTEEARKDKKEEASF